MRGESLAGSTTAKALRESGRFVGDQIVKGGAVVVAATVAMKLVSAMWRVIVGNVFGHEDYTALRGSHFFAVSIVFMVWAVFDQTIGPALLPVFSEEKNKRGEAGAWRFATAVMIGALVLSGAGAALAFTFPGAWTAFSEFLTNKEAPRDSSQLLSLQISYLAAAFLCVAISVITYKVLNSYKKFFWPQVGQGGMRLVMIGVTVGVVVAGLPQAMTARVLGIGVAVGSAFWLLIHLVALGRKSLMFGRPEFRSAAMRRFLLLAAPLFIGSVIAQFRDLVNYNAVLFPLSQQGADLITASSIGRTIPTGLDTLIPYSVSIAMFPYFCDMVDKGDLEGLGKILTRSSRVLMLAFFALGGAVAVMSLPFMTALYFNVDASTVRLAALVSACYVLVLPALAVEKFLMVGFFSNRRMVAPIVLGIVFSFLSVGVSVVGIRYFGLTGAAALATVALGYAFARYLKVLALAVVLRRTVPIFPARETAWFLVRALTVAGVCAGSAWLVRLGYETWRPAGAALAGGVRARLLFALPEIALGGGASIVAGLAAIKLLRMEEFGWVIDWIRRKRGGRGEAGKSDTEAES